MKRGFTLLELIIVISLLAIISTAVWPQLNGYQLQVAKRDDVSNVVSALRQAEASALVSYQNQSFGVKLFSDKIVVFVGDSYATRVVDSDREIKLNKSRLSINLTTGDEIVFQKNIATPSDYGRLDLLFTDGQTVSIAINRYGLIEKL